MKSQFTGIILFSLILVFVISFGYVNSVVSFDTGELIGPENLMLVTPTYYVKTTGSDGNTGTGSTDLEAWQSISHAMAQLSGTNGYILYIAAGTYPDNLNLTSSGTSVQNNEIIGDDVTPEN